MPDERLEIGPITSSDELSACIDQLSKQFAEKLLLFRGQNQLHPTVRSTLSRDGVRYEPEVELGLSTLAGAILGHGSASTASVPLRNAVLQHYGFGTHYVDLTSDSEIAAWFACNSAKENICLYAGSPVRHIQQIYYRRRPTGVGYILVMAISGSDALLVNRRLFELSDLKPFLRPQRQKAWLFYDRNPLLPDPNDFWVATIQLDCERLEPKFSSEYLFPPPAEDDGYERLLRSIPFVQIPAPPNETDGERRHPEDYSFGVRALRVPDYVHFVGRDEYDHKWKDETLTEARPMREWRNWGFALNEEFPGKTGNVADSLKLTLTPRALWILHKSRRRTRLRWPQLGSDDLLITQAQWGHDKVYDIEYPYHGTWLHRDKDLIFEHPITADEDVMNVHPGHVFEFLGQQLVRQEVVPSCACKSPKNHLASVKSVLRLSALIEAEDLILIPHPIRRAGWFYVIDK